MMSKTRMHLPETLGRPITIATHGGTSRAMAYYAHTAEGPDGTRLLEEFLPAPISSLMPSCSLKTLPQEVIYVR